MPYLNNGQYYDIEKETNAWSYALIDGTDTQRQLTDATGEVTYAARYTPWGDTLDSYGTGNFAFGYFGGLMDAATGLLYVGDGQYYDPTTGRFLTRNVRPNSANPYLPFDPTGALFVPLALVSLVYGRKRRKSKWDILVIVTLLSLSAGMGVAACKPGEQVTATITPVVTPTGTPSLKIDATTSSGDRYTAIVTGTPNLIPTVFPECATASTPTPSTPTPPLTPNLDNDIMDWGKNPFDDAWRTQRSQWVWDWLKERGGWWGSGAPSLKTLITMLLIGEGVGLMNNDSSDRRFDGMRVMVWYMRHLFDDGDGITAKDLSTFTAFFNPVRDASGAWNQADRDRYQKGFDAYTWSIASGFVDMYWGTGPYLHKNKIVYKWWDNTENFNYNVAFSVVIPIESKTLFFGYP